MRFNLKFISDLRRGIYYLVTMFCPSLLRYLHVVRFSRVFYQPCLLDHLLHLLFVSLVKTISFRALIPYFDFLSVFVHIRTFPSHPLSSSWCWPAWHWLWQRGARPSSLWHPHQSRAQTWHCCRMNMHHVFPTVLSSSYQSVEFVVVALPTFIVLMLHIHSIYCTVLKAGSR